MKISSLRPALPAAVAPRPARTLAPAEGDSTRLGERECAAGRRPSFAPTESRVLPVEKQQPGACACSRDGSRIYTSNYEQLLAVGKDGEVTPLLELDKPLAAPPTELADGSLLLVQGSSRDFDEGSYRLTRVRPEGEVAWSVPVDPETARHPLILRGDQVVGWRSRRSGQYSETHRLEALGLQDGNRLWEVDLGWGSCDVLADGRLLLGGGDGPLTTVDSAGRRAPLEVELPEERPFIHGLRAGADGGFWVSYGGSLCAYGPEGKLRWSREGYGERLPLAAGPEGVLFQGLDDELRGLDAATGEVLWSFPARVQESAVDDEGRLRFREYGPEGEELWTVDGRGRIACQPLPKDLLPSGAPVVAPGGKTVVAGFRGLGILPAPALDRADRTPLDVSRTGALPALGLESPERLSHLEDSEWEPLRRRAVDLNRAWHLARDQGRRDEAKRLEADHRFLVEVATDRHLSSGARGAVLASWGRLGEHHAEVERWRDLLGTPADSPGRERLYRALPDLLSPEPERVRRGLAGLPEDWLLGLCRTGLGEGWQPGPELTRDEVVGAAQAVRSAGRFLPMHGASALVAEVLGSGLDPAHRLEALSTVGSRLEELPYSEAIAFVDRARRVLARPDLDGNSTVALLRRVHDPAVDVDRLVDTVKLATARADEGSEVIDSDDAVTINGLRLEKRR